MIQEISTNKAVLMQPFSSEEKLFIYRLHRCKLSCDIYPRSQRAASGSFYLTAQTQLKGVTFPAEINIFNIS